MRCDVGGGCAGCEMSREMYTGDDPAVLSCWKDIARYLGKGVRTVQRWEREFELPVRRPKDVDRKSAVAAHPRDLDAWLASRWALRASKVTAQPVEARAELNGIKEAIQEWIHAARALRAEQEHLIDQLSVAMQLLIQNEPPKRGALETVQTRDATRLTSKDYSGLRPPPGLLETRRHSSEEQSMMRSGTDVI
jgi:hypothetical protein